MQRTLEGGYRLERSRQAAIVRWDGARRVLGTSALNGGMREDLAAVFNANDTETAGRFCSMRGATLAEHQAATAGLLGLDPGRTTGLNTGANIDNMAVRTVREDGYAFHVLATGGVEVNAMRAGDPATLTERDGAARPLVGGTVNLLCLFDADLTPGCLARALITLTEAKAAAFQELLVSSRSSRGIATGSGTDGAVLVSHIGAPVRLCEAGGHFRLGERLAAAAIDAVKEALYRQSGLCAQGQHSVFRRLERFGVTEEAVWKVYVAAVAPGATMAREQFREAAAQMSADGAVVALAGLYAHLLDQLDWGLLLPGEAVDAAERLLELMDGHHAVPHTARVAHAAAHGEAAGAMVRGLLDAVVNWFVVSGLQ